MSRALMLEKFAFYRDGTPDLQMEVRSSATETRLQRGAHFYLEGSHSEGFALVGLGRLRVYKLAETGREITLYQVQEGETCIVNMLSTILDQPAAASAIADTDVEALLFSPDTFRRWMRDFESVRDFVLRNLARRVVNVITLVEEVAFRKMDRRLASFLLGRFDRVGAEGVLEATHQDIAAQLGTAREAISRILEDFERRGAVALARGRVTLKDAAILLAVAEGSA